MYPMENAHLSVLAYINGGAIDNLWIFKQR